MKFHLPTHETESVNDYLFLYLQFLSTIGRSGRPVSPLTIKRYQYYIKFLQRFEVVHRHPNELTFLYLLNLHDSIQSEQTEDNESFSHSYLTGVQMFFNKTIDFYYKVNNIQCNPPKLLPFKKTEPRTDRHVLNKKEAGWLLDALQSNQTLRFYYPLALLILITGARYCEASALHWSDLDFKKNRFRFLRHQACGIIQPNRKQGKVSSWYPITPQLKAAFLNHKKGSSNYIVFSHSKDPTRSKYKGYIHSSDFRKRLHEACLLAKIPPVSPHDLRRTVNTELLRQHCDPTLTQAVLGHSDPKMTDLYCYFEANDKYDFLLQLENTFVPSQHAAIS